MTDTTEPTKVKRISCLVYSRVVGYLRPTVSWADHKRQEFKDRRVYAMPTEEELR
jgi:ribonucleoside-triphosphate reductase (formate)